MITAERTAILARMMGHEQFPLRDSVYVRWYPKTLSVPSVSVFSPDEAVMPTGAYIHVPFCDRICRFCPFNKRETDRALVEQFVAALLDEIRLYSGLTLSPGIDFVYFGGGTPSVLAPTVIEQIINQLHRTFGMQPGAEVTLEAHPTHLTRSFVRDVRACGVTRISTGIQAFDDSALQRLGSNHTARDCRTAIDAVSAELGAVAIDLLFRCEGQELTDWERQLKTTVQFGTVGHVSCYSLVLKDGAHQPSPDVEAEMTILANAIFRSNGYEHYASCASGGFDYAVPGHKCRYEQRHWAAPQAQFLGFGPGAFGFLGERTTVNGLDLARYFRCIDGGQVPIVSATRATIDERRRRYFVLGVKTLAVPLTPFREIFGLPAEACFADEFELLRSWDFARIDGDVLVLTQIGRLYVDTVSAVFFSATERDVPHPEEPEVRQIELAGR